MSRSTYRPKGRKGKRRGCGRSCSWCAGNRLHRHAKAEPAPDSGAVSERHPDFVCVEVTATYGSGPYRAYAGREPFR